MIDHQLAIFLDGDWSGTARETVLQQLQALTRPDVVQTYYDRGDATVITRPLLYERYQDPVLERAERAYRWLCERYRDGSTNYVFGFGAGAIAALRLARLVAVGGLLRRPDELRLEHIVGQDKAGLDAPAVRDMLYFRDEFSRPMRIRFLGLLDAAGPFGHGDQLQWMRFNRDWVEDGRLNPIVDHAFHALAVDESRDLYQPVLWQRVSPHTRSVAQPWFRGSHLDLGGALTDFREPLASFPLERLAREAARHRFALRRGWDKVLHAQRAGVVQWRIGQREPWGGGIDVPFTVERFDRDLGAALGGAPDPSVSDPFLSRDIGLARNYSFARPSRPRLAGDVDTSLFVLNNLKAPTIWSGPKVLGLLGEQRGRGFSAFRLELEGAGAAAQSEQSVRPSSRRFLLTQFRQGVEEHDAEWTRFLEAKKSTWVWVRIGFPRPEWLPEKPNQPFPEETLPRNAGGDELKVVLSAAPVIKQPIMQTVVLRRQGESTDAVFALGELAAGEIFEARVTVLHRNRVLQSAVLRGPVEMAEPASLITDARIVKDLTLLSRRGPADVSILMNESTLRGERALIVSGELAREIEADADDQSLADIIGALASLAGDPEINSRPLTDPAKLLRLRNLAIQGRGIYGVLKEAMPEVDQASMPPWPTSIQVVAAHSSKLHPVELMYDYPGPAATAEVKLCPYWTPETGAEQGSEKGCYARCALTSPAAFICPNGFWGSKKVIERHAFASGIDESDEDADVRKRKRLCIRGPAVLGVSKIVHGADANAMKQMLSSLKTLLQSEPAEPVHSWEHLKDLVSQYAPPLIVLLPHVQYQGPYAGEVPAPTGVYLEIEDILQRASEINQGHLQRGDIKPLVMLLGCEAAMRYSKFDDAIAHFRRAGAAAVLAPLATVAPLNVVDFVRDFAQALRRVLGKLTPRIGEALRDARRAELARGNLLALCIMGFGDGDWRITLKE